MEHSTGRYRCRSTKVSRPRSSGGGLAGSELRVLTMRLSRLAKLISLVGFCVLAPGRTSALGQTPPDESSKEQTSHFSALPTPIASSVAFAALREGLPPARGVLEISGELRYPLQLLVASKLVFKPGARLILTAPPDSKTGQTQITIVAESVEAEDSQAILTWEPGPLPPTPTAPQSGGSTGATGTDGDGGPGAPGQRGGDGPPGFEGRPAPSVTLIVSRAVSIPQVRLVGQAGGSGGVGQPGGVGGRGGRGNDASLQAFQCARGAGNGGSGGAGGQGGRGGDGGSGGAGGQFTLLTASLSNQPPIKMLLQGGPGGQPGIGGPGGNGGAGGDGGSQALPWCSGAGNQGTPGMRGSDGPPGAAGQPGRDGQAFIGGLDNQQMRTILAGSK
jgi:hypothetical protein